MKIPDSWILTPHEGELARLIKRSSAEVKANRIDSLEAAYKKYQCTIILKGAETLIISPETSVVKKIKSGTPALAKAGTGDVLLGMVSAFRAQGLSSLDAAVLGTTLHGLAAREWLKKKNDHLSLRPVDLIELLPKILYKIRGTR